MKQIIIHDLTVDIEKKRIKNMYLRILPPDGRIHISAPYATSEEAIRRFILSRMEWIDKQRDRIAKRAEEQELEYQSNGKLSLWGKVYTLMIVDDVRVGKKSSVRESISIEGDTILLTVKKGSTKEERARVLNSWYKELLAKEIPKLLAKWEEMVGVQSDSWTIRDMKTRWGTCNIRTRKITLNLKLAKKLPECLEYVIVHELVHLLEPSHNRRFKDLMTLYLPNWKRIKKALNET